MGNLFMRALLSVRPSGAYAPSMMELNPFDHLAMSSVDISYASRSMQVIEVQPKRTELSPAQAVKKLAVDIREAGAMLGVSAQTVQREIDRGNLRALKIGKQWRIRITELNAYLERLEGKA